MIILHLNLPLKWINKYFKETLSLYAKSHLVTIYRSFIRPHLDYADVMFDKPSNATFSNWIESAQDNAALAVTGKSKEKLYQELGFDLSCSLEADDTYHFFMRCQNCSNQRNVLFDDFNAINSEILKMRKDEIVRVLLFGSKSFSKDMNFRIITPSVRFIKDSKRLDESLSSWEKPFRHIFTAIKIWNIFLPSVSVFYYRCE